MILQALNAYYERLAADPEQDIAPYGFSRQKISFCIVLNADGSLHAINDLRTDVDGRLRPALHVVPHPGGKRTSGVKPYFLWDKTAYVLGRDLAEEEKGGAKKRKRLQQQFEAFRKLHLTIQLNVDSPVYDAVCHFLEHWDPSQAETLDHWDELSGQNVIFNIRGQTQHVHHLPEVRAAWITQLEPGKDKTVADCLVTNRSGVLARTHLPIKGVADPGGQAEKSIVSFNLEAFESYGKDQSYNAPVGAHAAFQYCTALNRLLADKQRRVQIGDATTVFWSERPTKAERVLPQLFAGLPAASETAEDDEAVSQIRAFLNRLRQGKPDEQAAELEDAATHFYILGLSPNSSRISVRFWLQTTVGLLSTNLARHVQQLEIVGLGDRVPLIRELLRETAPLKKGYPDDEKVPRPLSAGMMRAVIQGEPYPMSFFQAILRRIGSERFVDTEKRKGWRYAMAVRAAGVKAVLIRNFKKEISVSLNTERKEPAYQLGRWFAVLEKVQKDQPGGEKIKSTIRDRFFTAASSTPAVIFPRLIHLSQHHLDKIENPGLRITREKQIQEIASRIDSFPRHLSLENQGLFHLGYYHQTQDLYTKKSDTEVPETVSTESE